jgi:preprotein translocase subunit SecG
MAFLYYLFISVHIIACLFLIAVVLLQQGKGQDLASAFGGGGSQTAFGPRGSATVLSRATTILAAVFMITSLGLSMFKTGRSSVLDQVQDTATVPGPMAEETPATTAPPPAAPAAGDTAGSTAEEPTPAEAPQE